MINIHCHTCGGFISDPQFVSLRTPSGAVIAAPRSGICTCSESVIFGPPTDLASLPDLEGAGRLA